MALRVRKNGKIVCAKDYAEEDGDIYINDSIHEFLGGCTDRSSRVIFYNKEKDRWTFFPTKKIIKENT